MNHTVTETTGGKRRGAGFTLLELMLAVAIMAVVSVVTYMTFSTVTKAWRSGVALTDDLNHGEFVMEQLIMGLKSAYFPDTRVKDARYGFWMEDNGFGESSDDTISWVKLGGSLVGKNCPFAGSPHRVRFSLEDDDEADHAITVRAWQLLGQSEDFDPDADVEPISLSHKVVGFNCRLADPTERDADGGIEWLDEWEETNRLPTIVEITLYMEPIDDGEDAVEIKRIVGIPVAPLSWK